MVPFDRGLHWTPVKLCPYGEGHVRFGRVTIVVSMTRCRSNAVWFAQERWNRCAGLHDLIWRELSSRKK